jgi:hypothetical protein
VRRRVSQSPAGYRQPARASTCRAPPVLVGPCAYLQHAFDGPSDDLLFTVNKEIAQGRNSRRCSRVNWVIALFWIPSLPGLESQRVFSLKGEYSRSGLTNLSWQAFRVFNAQDVVPHAYADIEGIADSGIPLSLVLKLSVGATAALVETILRDNHVSYVQLGNGEGLNNNTPQVGQPSCANPAETLDGFVCWFGYEHSSLTYLGLLGVPTDGMADHSSNL